MYITRDIERRIATLTQQFFVLLVTGPRQVGKTTLLKHLSESLDDGRTIVSLDDLDLRAFAKADPRGFIAHYPPPVLIDEVQYAPVLFDFIKIEVDRRQSCGDYWLTGSQKFHLMRGVNESLAGRVGILELGALSQNELYNHFSPPHFDYTLLTARSRVDSVAPLDKEGMFQRTFLGGMPRVHVVKDLDLKVFFDGYKKTYIERDVTLIDPDIDTVGFLDFLPVVAARNAQLLNVDGIARDARITGAQARKWLEVLEALGIIYYVRPYSNNLLTRTVKTPKLYFFDTGMLCDLLNIHSVGELIASNAAPAVFENYLINQLSLSRTNSAYPSDLYYYRDYDAREIDWVEIDGEGVHPIEIKETTDPSPHLVRPFRSLDKGSVVRGKGAIVSNSPDVVLLENRTVTLPAWCV